MTDDDKLEQLFRAGDAELEDRGFSARVLRRLRMRPAPRRWIIPLVFTIAGVGLALAISPLPDPASMHLGVWTSTLSNSAISLVTCTLVALLAIGALLAKEEA
jgi:hypothetical protein